MIWLWAAALGTTLGGLVVVVRALSRADAAVAAVRATTEAVHHQVPEAHAALDQATGNTARRREALAACVLPS